jgi:hypothetical protein
MQLSSMRIRARKFSNESQVANAGYTRAIFFEVRAIQDMAIASSLALLTKGAL